MIQEIVCARPTEFAEVARPAHDDLRRCVAAFEAIERGMRAQQFDDLLELELLRIWELETGAS
jgi:hypothetical protein